MAAPLAKIPSCAEVIIARRLHIQLEPLIPDSQAGFRPARGTRDNVCILKWTINMLLRESKPAVVTFIDYAAAFDTESQLFLDEALSSAGASPKLRRITQAIFNVATGCVRVTSPNGNQEFSEPFEISRGVLQGDIFSPVAFIIGLMRIFALHDIPNAGVTVGSPPYQVTISRLEYADDAGLLDGSVQEASQRISRIASGSKDDAAMEISVPKTKAMHIHSKERVSKTTEAEVAALNLKHRCPECTREFPTKRGLAIHRSRWCLHHPSTANTRSRTGTLADKEVQRQKRLAKEKERPHVTLQGQQLENVHAFDYLGSRMQCDGDQEADVNYRMVIAQTRFSSLQHIWRDHRLPHSMKVRLYKSSVCSTLTHSCEAWDLTRDVTRMINGFNSRCLQVITKKHFRDTATNPDYNLMLTIRRRRLRYLGHILRMDPSRLFLRVLASPRAPSRFLHVTSACHKAQAAKYKISKDGNKPLTYEMANPPHFIGVRKSWNSWHTSNLWEQPGAADRTFEDMFIRKFLQGTFHNCLADEIIVKRRHNTIFIALLLLRKLDPQKYYFLVGYTETLLSHFLKCPVKVEVSVVPRKVIYKYI
ncbi:28S ribosomal protein S24, mitochondrial [Branchiostoma belcheri]|nr:28S ribosomal protein S24, mitochondrial [Branchiostoma belcheri]